MHASLEKKYKKIIQEYNSLLQECACFSFEELNQPITTGKWSVAQILTHCNSSVSAVLGYLQHKLQQPQKIPNKNITTWFRSKLLNAALKSDLKFKAPKSIETVSQEIHFEEIKTAWTKQQTALQNLLFSFPLNLLDKTVFRHPVAGRVTMDQTLEFLYLHLLHHKRQILRHINNIK